MVPGGYEAASGVCDAVAAVAIYRLGGDVSFMIIEVPIYI